MGGDNSKGRKEYRKFLGRGVTEDLANPLEIGKGTRIIGEESFVQWIKDSFLRDRQGKREQPALRELKKLLPPQVLMDHFFRLSGKRKEDILIRGKNLTERAMLMELMYRFCQVTQPQIGIMVGGIDYSAVSQARSRLRNRLRKDKKLKHRFEKFDKQLTNLSRLKI